MAPTDHLKEFAVQNVSRHRSTRLDRFVTMSQITLFLGELSSQRHTQFSLD